MAPAVVEKSRRSPRFGRHLLERRFRREVLEAVELDPAVTGSLLRRTIRVLPSTFGKLLRFDCERGAKCPGYILSISQLF